MKGFERVLLLATIRPAKDEGGKDIQRPDQGRDEAIEDDGYEEEEEQDRGLAVVYNATKRLIRKAFSVC